jgi:hypothetical protein
MLLTKRVLDMSLANNVNRDPRLASATPTHSTSFPLQPQYFRTTLLMMLRLMNVVANSSKESTELLRRK